MSAVVSIDEHRPKSQKQQDEEDVISHVVQNRKAHMVPADIESTNIAINESCELMGIELTTRQKNDIIRKICP